MLPPRIVRYLNRQLHPSSYFLFSIFYFLLFLRPVSNPSYAQNSSAPEPSSPPILIDAATPVPRQQLSELVSSIERTSCQPERRIYNPITVAEFAGGAKVKSIRLLHYARLNPPMDTKEIQKTLRRVWESSFDDPPSCGIVWSELTFWSIEAFLDFDDGKHGLLITDGSHIALRDHDSHAWFFRRSPLLAIP